MPTVCVFDVNETLLDLSALDGLFGQIFGRPGQGLPGVRREWFGQMLQSALVATVTNAYSDFGRIGAAALEMTAARHGVALTPTDQAALLEAMQVLPAHPDVVPALDRLRQAGMRLATLTNSTAVVAEAQLRSAGIRDYFEQALSADAVRRLKPAPEPYAMAAARLGVPLGSIRLIAAHAWDVAGALRAGCAAGFVRRAGAILDPLVAPPDVNGADLEEVAAQILEREGRAPA